MTQSDLDDLVCPFGLSVRLQMVGRCDKEVCTEDFEERGPKFGEEHLAAIGNDLLRNAPASIIMFEKRISPLDRTPVFASEDKHDHFGEFVRYSHD